MESKEDTRGKGKKKIISGILETRGTSLDLYNEMREDNALTLL
jgi:hypothetical protein